MNGLFPPIEWPMLTESQTWAILSACMMMVCDVLTGFLGACIRHDVSSSKMREGLGHKILVLVMIAMAYVLGVGLSHISGVDVSIPSTEVVCSYVIVMELSSVLENVNRAWPEFSATGVYKAFHKIAEVNDDPDNASR